MHAAHVIYYGCGIQVWPVYLTRTILSYCCPLELAAVSKAMPTSKVGESSLWIRQLSPRMLSIDALAVREKYVVSKLLVEIFSRMVENLRNLRN